MKLEVSTISNPMNPIDNNGSKVHAHGGSMIKVGHKWYWFGENKRYQDWYFDGVNCYSSVNLQDWQFEGTVILPSGSGNLSHNKVAYRPKVLYNDSIGKYVMFITECNADCSDGHLCFATSDTVTGPYAYQGWCYGFGGRHIMDMSVFKDDDGQAYVLYSANTDGTGHWIDSLSSDYLSIVSNASRPSTQDREAPCIFKTGGCYYLCFSECTGWASNQSHYVTATSINGSWSSEADFGDRTTFNSQGGCILSVSGTKGATFVYIGDRWNYQGTGDSCDFRKSEYIWLPINIDGSKISIDYYDEWRLDLAEGIWSAG